MATILAVDVGTVRVGCAAADESVRIPFPVAIWNKAGGEAERSLIRTIQERAASIVVVGLPLGPNGEETTTCELVRSFVRRLTKRCAVTVHFVDESFSSVDAKERLGETSNPSPHLDSFAACLILERYFEHGPVDR